MTRTTAPCQFLSALQCFLNRMHFELNEKHVPACEAKRARLPSVFMSLDGGVSDGSYRALIRLLGELGELQQGSAEQTRRHLMERLSSLFGAPLWWSIVEPAKNPPPGKSPEVKVVRSDVCGLLDWQQRYWQQSFIDAGSYLVHPMWDGINRQVGCARTFRREQLIDDRHWYGSPAVAEFQRHLGFDDTLVCVTPLGDLEVLLALCRPWGDRRFDDRESMLLTLFQQAARWIHRQWLHEPAPAAISADPHTRLHRLSPRHRRVLDLILRGQSEKETAALTQLSVRTVHKYVEQIYRAFQVNSRAELMALWIK